MTKTSRKATVHEQRRGSSDTQSAPLYTRIVGGVYGQRIARICGQYDPSTYAVVLVDSSTGADIPGALFSLKRDDLNPVRVIQWGRLKSNKAADARTDHH
jgi:hypothetical protein